MSDIEVSKSDVTNKKAVTSFVLVFLSIVFVILPLVGIALAVVGIVLGFIGLKEITRYSQKGKAIAIIGIICNTLIIFSLVSGYMLFMGLNAS